MKESIRESLKDIVVKMLEVMSENAVLEDNILNSRYRETVYLVNTLENGDHK